LAVRALSPDGRRPQAFISVREKNGRVTELEQTDRDVRFCGLGILSVDVTVGQEGCNQVVVRDVPISPEQTFLLNITYDVEPCLYSDVPLPPKPICDVMLRVSGPGDKWLSSVPISVTKPITSRLVTDRFGRAFLTVATSNKIAGSISLQGYDRKEFSFSCTSSDYEFRGVSRHEEPIELGPEGHK
jgi:hypothetical protein